MLNIQPLPDDLRAALVESMRELKHTFAQIERVQRQIDTLPRKPRKSRLEPITAPAWYINRPDPILANGGRAGHAMYPELFKTEAAPKKPKSKSAA